MHQALPQSNFVHVKVIYLLALVVLVQAIYPISASLEAIIGVLYITIIMARLVKLYAREKF